MLLLTFGGNMRKSSMFLAMVLILWVYPVSYSQDVSLVVDILPRDNLQVGDIVKIYGYVYDRNLRENIKIEIYVNDVFEGSVLSNKEGYFEGYVKIREPGLNFITVRYKNAVAVFEIIAKPKLDVRIEDNTYYDKVIVVGEKVTTLYPYMLEDAEEIKNQYVNVEVSSKEVVVGKYGGSSLKIKIYNHLNESKVFDVELNGLSDEHYYSTGAIELKPKERGEIVLYIRPLEVIDRKELTLTIKANGEVIDEKTIVLMSTNKQGRIFSLEEDAQFMDVNMKGIISLMLIFGGLVLVFYGMVLFSSPTNAIVTKK